MVLSRKWLIGTMGAVGLVVATTYFVASTSPRTCVSNPIRDIINRATGAVSCGLQPPRRPLDDPELMGPR